MTKRVLVFILSVFIISVYLTGCTSKAQTQNETINNETIVETTSVESTTSFESKVLPSDVSIDTLSMSLRNQFGSYNNEIDSINLKMYISDTADYFSESALFMEMKHANNLLYMYVPGMTTTWLTENTIYYFDETNNEWFKDNYSGEIPDDSENTIIGLATGSFPTETTVSTKVLNDNTYTVASFLDSDGYTVDYYFEEVDGVYLLKILSSTDPAFGYTFIVLNFDEVVLPEEVINASQGNYEEYASSHAYNFENDIIGSLNDNEESTNSTETNSTSEAISETNN